jgi:hypothetical protein
MSYILDALKRLEQDKAAARRGRNPIESLAEPEPARERLWSRKRLLGLGIGLVLILAITVALTYRLAHRAGSALVAKETVTGLARSSAGSSQSEPRPLAGASGLEVKKNGVASKERSGAALREAARPVQGFSAGNREHLTSRPQRLFPLSPSARPSRAHTPESSPPASSLQKPSENSGDEETASRAGQEEAVESESQPGEQPERSAGRFVAEDENGSGEPDEPEAPQAVESLEESSPDEGVVTRAAEAENVYANGTKEGIKISAIVWSPDKKSRFAMVNLKTVYEGDSIDGRGIVEIQEDGVVFMEGNEQYKVTLNAR